MKGHIEVGKLKSCTIGFSSGIYMCNEMTIAIFVVQLYYISARAIDLCINPLPTSDYRHLL